MFGKLQFKMSDGYRAYSDKGKLYSKQDNLKRMYRSVMKDLRHTQARTKEQVIQTAKSLYELADCESGARLNSSLKLPLYYKKKRFRWKNRLRRCVWSMDN